MSRSPNCDIGSLSDAPCMGIGEHAVVCRRRGTRLEVCHAHAIVFARDGWRLDVGDEEAFAAHLEREGYAPDEAARILAEAS